MGSPEAGWVENKPTRGWRSALRASELWAQRELALLFAWRELKLRYKQTAFGVAWILLQPLLAMVLFSVVVERAVGIPSDGIAYPVFAYVGLAVWAAVNTAISRAAESLTRDADLVTKVHFPRFLAPTGSIMPAAVDMAIALTLLAPLMAAYDVTPPIELLFLPLCIAWVIVAVLAVGAWLSALNVLYRDVRLAMPFALQVWFLASPVLFPSSLVQGDAHLLFFVNPVTGPIDAVRAATLGTPVDAAGLCVSFGAMLAIGLSGLAYFHRVERTFADRI